MESDDELLDDRQAARLRELLESDGVNNNEEAVVFSDDDEAMDEAMDDGIDDEDYVEEGGDEQDEEEGEEEEEREKIADAFDEPGTDREAFGFSDEDVELSESDIDEEFEFRNALREASNFRVKSRKKKDAESESDIEQEVEKIAPPKKKKRKGGLAALRRKIRRENLSPEVKLLLGKANEAFVKNDLSTAAKQYLEVVKMDKNNFSAYKTLGEIARLQGDYNRCSNFWLLAAHIHQWDYEFWRELAELSVELGHQRQALYCYTKAIRASHHKDYESIFARACLYREREKFKRATDSLLKLRSILPHEPKVVRELAKVYVDENRVNDAITMYNKLLEENMTYRRLREKGEKVELKNITFDWSELNILSELYSSKGAWQLGIKALRQISRWIQQRENQEFWDEHLEVDVEFDERRFDYPKFQNFNLNEKKKQYSLPIDIRVQLGLFRLNSKNEDEALKHFGFLLEQPIEDTADLFLKVGTELESFGLYKEALEFLVPLSYIEEQNTPELVLAIAKCLRETQDFGNAKEAYMRLLEYNPDDVEIKVALAEVCFYLNDMETTARLYKEAKLQRSREKASARSNLLTAVGDEDLLENADDNETENDVDDIFNETHQALIADLPQKKSKRKKIDVSAGELRTMETKSENRIRKQYDRAYKILQTLEERSLPSTATNSKAIASLWIDLASDLIEIFSMYRCFFSSERARRFNVGLRKRTAKLSVDHKLWRMRYLQNEIILSSEMDQPEQALARDSFKGIGYEQWYDLFLKYSLMIAQYEGDVDSAMAILDIARHVNVFKENELSTTLVGLSVGLITKDHTLVQNQVRTMMNDYQFCPMVLRIFLASHIPDSYSSSHYADPSTQKYILRQVKAYDALKDGKDVSGMAAITNRNVDLAKNHPLLNYIYASFLYFNKSYYSSLSYCLKLYHDFPNDPSLLFLLALSNLNRSTQRKTLNTNFQILQGLTFLLEYTKLKDFNDPYQKMEALYNVGRAFHQLGLDNIAIGFYEKVLGMEVEDENYDLKRETAYNLCIIYNIHQNFRLAEEIMDKYLVV
ncbi:DEKNAAC103869 [Brettanomyces naardenensis]|uniref:DEKNAAC103869 n=1 Tax=Brettanomyces naardenensis TaxID=13370 RepID=A0A448YPK1_BRENA|nr:DEKNAAC103869 [Brettanomyces naardenensis]